MYLYIYVDKIRISAFNKILILNVKMLVNVPIRIFITKIQIVNFKTARNSVLCQVFDNIAFCYS